MAKAKVKVGFYTATRYNSFFSAGTVISEEKFEELVADRKKELENNDGEFEDYLADNYSWKEIFEMNEDERAEVRSEYADRCVDWARDELNDDWDYNEFETEVEVPAEVPSTSPKGKCPCPCNR